MAANGPIEPTITRALFFRDRKAKNFITQNFFFFLHKSKTTVFAPLCYIKEKEIQNKLSPWIFFIELHALQIKWWSWNIPWQPTHYLNHICRFFFRFCLLYTAKIFSPNYKFTYLVKITQLAHWKFSKMI